MFKLDREIVKGSIILLIVFNLYSLINFLFQASMARLLTLSDYGVLAALGYLMNFSSIFAESLQIVVARYSAIESDPGKLKNLVRRAFRKSWFWTVILFLSYCLIMLPVSYFREIPYFLSFLNGLVIFTILFIPITRGVLQGRKRFYSLGTSLISEAGIKIIVGVGLVLMGWKLYGAVVGLIFGLFISLGISIFLLRSILSKKEKSFGEYNLYKESRPLFLASFALLGFYTIDIFLAQIVFSKEIAGAYAIVSILSKIIFWGTQPISKALFPISVKRHSNKDNENKHAFSNALVLVSLGVICALLAFYFFPEQIIRLFSNKELPIPLSLLFLLGISTSILSYANLVLLYKASKGKTINQVYFLGIVFLGAIAMVLFSQTVIEFSVSFLMASIAFLCASIWLIE